MLAWANKFGNNVWLTCFISLHFGKWFPKGFMSTQMDSSSTFENSMVELDIGPMNFLGIPKSATYK
jgi:hypothetical protein